MKTNLIVRTYKGFRKITVCEVAYLEAHSKSTMVHMVDKNTIDARHIFGELMAMCPACFACCYRGYAVNLEHVNAVDEGKKKLVLCNSVELPISVNRKSEFIAKWKSHINTCCSVFVPNKDL